MPSCAVFSQVKKLGVARPRPGGPGLSAAEHDQMFLLTALVTIDPDSGSLVLRREAAYDAGPGLTARRFQQGYRLGRQPGHGTEVQHQDVCLLPVDRRPPA